MYQNLQNQTLIIGLLYIHWSSVTLVLHATRELKELLCMTVVIETIQRTLLSIVKVS